MRNANVLILQLISSVLFGISASIDEWRYARWPFLGGIFLFYIWVLTALSKVAGL